MEGGYSSVLVGWLPTGPFKENNNRRADLFHRARGLAFGGDTPWCAPAKRAHQFSPCAFVEQGPAYATQSVHPASGDSKHGRDHQDRQRDNRRDRGALISGATSWNLAGISIQQKR